MGEEQLGDTLTKGGAPVRRFITYVLALVAAIVAIFALTLPMALASQEAPCVAGTLMQMEDHLGPGVQAVSGAISSVGAHASDVIITTSSDDSIELVDNNVQQPRGAELHVVVAEARAPSRGAYGYNELEPRRATRIESPRTSSARELE